MSSRRSYGRSTTIPFDELDDWARFARLNDPRLADPATALDVCRSLYKLAKNAASQTRSADNLRSDNGITVLDRPILQEGTITAEPVRFSQNDTDQIVARARVAETILDKRIQLEKYRAETARWRSQATAFPYKIGSVEWSGDGPPRTAHRANESWYQGIHRVCGHVHDLTEACPRGEP